MSRYLVKHYSGCFVTVFLDEINIYITHSAGGCDGAHSAAERSYPTSEARGRSQEDPMPEGRRPRGVIQRPRSGVAAESARLRQRRNGREELPHVRGQEQRQGGATTRPRSGAAAESARLRQRRNGGEELPHVRGQGWQPGGATPPPRRSLTIRPCS